MAESKDPTGAPRNLQLESYHGTGTSIVAMMASSGRVQVDPEHLRGGDRTLRRAMELWSCRNGAVPYNKWQSVYFALIRRGYEDRTAPFWPDTAVGETQQEKQKRIREMYVAVQTDLHGPDYLALAVKADPLAGIGAAVLGPVTTMVGQGSSSDAALALAGQGRSLPSQGLKNFQLKLF